MKTLSDKRKQLAIEKIMKSNVNKVEILLNPDKFSIFSQEYLEDLIRYGYNKGAEDNGFVDGIRYEKAKILEIIKELNEKFRKTNMIWDLTADELNDTWEEELKEQIKEAEQ